MEGHKTWHQLVGILWEEAGAAAIDKKAGGKTTESVYSLRLIGVQINRCKPGRSIVSLIYK